MGVIVDGGAVHCGGRRLPIVTYGVQEGQGGICVRGTVFTVTLRVGVCGGRWWRVAKPLVREPRTGTAPAATASYRGES